jgi:hypothetical protein
VSVLDADGRVGRQKFLRLPGMDGSNDGADGSELLNSLSGSSSKETGSMTALSSMLDA